MRTKIGIENLKTISKNTATTTTRIFIASFLSFLGMEVSIVFVYISKKVKSYKSAMDAALIKEGIWPAVNGKKASNR